MFDVILTITPSLMTDEEIREIERLEHGPILGPGVVDEDGRFAPVGDVRFGAYCQRVRLHVRANR